MGFPLPLPREGFFFIDTIENMEYNTFYRFGICFSRFEVIF